MLERLTRRPCRRYGRMRCSRRTWFRNYRHCFRYYRGVQVEANLLPKVQVDIVVSKVPVRSVIETAKKVLYTGHIGDGKIFVYDVENVVKVRTGEEGYDALQDVE